MKSYYLTTSLIFIFTITILHSQDFEVGTLPGFPGSSNSGAATYTIPIDIPSGRAGITPRLSFTYNSHGQGNIMGRGWSLTGFSSIYRINPSLYYSNEIDNIDFDNDQLAIDGLPLMYIGEVPEGKEYRTETDNVEKVIYCDSDWPHFKVYMRNGTVREYGNNQASRQSYNSDGTVGSESPLAWHLNKVMDVAGNKIEYIYTHNDEIGEIHPNEIHYTGFEGKSEYGESYYTIKFKYNDLDVHQVTRAYLEKLESDGFYTSYINMNSKLLTSISLYHNSTEIKKYNLEYYYGMGITDEIYLREITQTIGGIAVSPTTFDWYFYNPEYEICADVIYDSRDDPAYKSRVSMTNLDIDGDGKDEIAVYKVLSTSDGDLTCDVHFYNTNPPINNIHLNISEIANVTLSSADFDFDSRDELLVNIEGNSLRVYDFTDLNQPYLKFEHFYNGDEYEPFLGDFDGNGVTDCFIADNSTKQAALLIASLDNELFYSAISDNYPLDVKYVVNVSDFDGDNIADIACFDGSTARIYNFTDGFSNTSLSQVFIGSTGRNYYNDFNGDGKTDICNLLEHDTGFGKRTFFSFGHGFIEDDKEDNNPNYMLPDMGYPVVADMNSDSRADFVYMNFTIDGGLKFLTLDNYYTTKRGINQSESVQLDLEIAPHIQGIGAFTFADITGSGIVDMAFEFIQEEEVIPKKHSDLILFRTHYYLYMFSDLQVQENHIKKIINGLGKTTVFNYKKFSSSYGSPDQYNYPISRYESGNYLISECYNEDGSNKLNHRTYSFNNPIMHIEGKGFLGFGSVAVTSNSTGTKHITNYEIYGKDQGKYFYNYPKTITTFSIANENILKTSENTIALVNLTPNNKVFYTLVTESTSKSWDLDGSFISQNKRSINIEDIDTYGNILLISSMTSEQNNTSHYEISKKIISSYENIDKLDDNGRKYITGRPSTILKEAKRGEFEENVLQEEYIYYKEKETSGYWPFLKTKIVSPNPHIEGSEKFVLSIYNKEYDKYGNLLKQTLAAPNDAGLEERITEYVYDANISREYYGRFLTEINKSIDGINYNVKYEYDPVMGQLESEESVSGLITSYKYDKLGRLEKITYPDGSTEHYYQNWVDASMGDLAPDLAVYQSGLISSNSGYLVSFFDKYGRKLRTCYPGYDYQVVLKDYEYNHNGNLWKDYKPYFYGEDNSIFTEFRYDELNRVTSHITPTNILETNFAGRIITSINTGTGIEHTKELSSDGLLRKVTDPTGTITYNYNSANVIESIINLGTETTIKYDPAGNKTEFHETNLGVSTSEFNAFGETIHHVDGRGNSTYYEYDLFGRLTLRTMLAGSKEIPDITSYNYCNDPESNAFGQLESVLGNTEYHFTYDELGRLVNEQEKIADNTYNTGYEYYNGRLNRYIYPSGFSISYDYDINGYLENVIDDQSGTNIWKHISSNSTFRPTEYQLGNGLITKRTYHDDSGLPISIKTGNIQDLLYGFDNVTGNLRYRIDYNFFLSEIFHYDELLNSRLTEWHIYNGTDYNDFYAGYSDNGNITYKSDVTNYTNTEAPMGSYQYDDNKQVNAVTGVSMPTPDYLNNTGNQSIKYTGFNKVDQIHETAIEGNQEVDYKIDFLYGPFQNRKTTWFYKHDILQKVKYFVGSSFEIEKRRSGGERKLHYISGGDGLTAIYVQNGGQDTMYYIHKNYLGSIYCVTDETGEIVSLGENKQQIYSFDPWGRRRNYQTWSFMDVPGSFLFDRGFTTHEHMDNFGLINMNGRVYDPRLGRMLSPDPFVQDNTYSQSYNRYSYAFNNPLKYIDPTGYRMCLHDILKLDGPFNSLNVNYSSLNLPNYSISQGNHWINQQLSEYENYLLMNNTAFENNYGSGSLNIAKALWGNEIARKMWRNKQLTIEKVRENDGKYWNATGGEEVYRNVYVKDGVTYADIYFSGKWVDLGVENNSSSDELNKNSISGQASILGDAGAIFIPHEKFSEIIPEQDLTGKQALGRYLIENVAIAIGSLIRLPATPQITMFILNLEGKRISIKMQADNYNGNGLFAINVTAPGAYPKAALFNADNGSFIGWHHTIINGAREIRYHQYLGLLRKIKE